LSAHWVNISPAVNNEQTIWCNKQGGWNVAGFDFYVNSYQTNDGIIYFDEAEKDRESCCSAGVLAVIEVGQMRNGAAGEEDETAVEASPFGFGPSRKVIATHLFHGFIEFRGVQGFAIGP
jgi:hypothetical protein